MANFEFKRLNINMAKYKARRDKKRKYARYSAYVLSIFVLVFLSVTTITNSKTITMTAKRFLAGLGVYTETVPNVEIQSPNYDAEGSWHINKSAKWLSGDTAEITLDVDSVLKRSNNKYKDIILVIDTSGSMVGDRIEKVKEDSKDLIEYMLSRTGNKVALITFADHSTIQSNLTVDKDSLIDKIDAITIGGNTNYNEPLQNVDEILSDYSHTDDREAVVLFLTDGSPNKDKPRQVGTYTMLKDKYPYLIVSGIQFEVGYDTLYELRQISDEQYSTNIRTLKNVLFEAAARPLKYEKFIIEDVIDNDSFSVSSVNDIEVSKGTVALDTSGSKQKVIWDMNGLYQTGGKESMTIKVKLKNSYVTTKGYYGTNTSTSVNYMLEDNENTVTSTNTPVLQNYYTVIYDTNGPTGCSLSSIANEDHFIYTNVTKKTTELSCEGYLYKGMDIDDNDNDDVRIINDSVFIMPEHDVHVRGTWSRQKIEKSMDGTVHEKNTLYKTMENQLGTYTSLYTGTHKDYYVEPDPTEKTVTKTEYDIVSNTEATPFTFNNSTKKWTSSNHTKNTTGSIKFNVQKDGDYKLNYNVSSEPSYDKIYVYKNSEELKVDSGIKSDTIELNGLTTTDEIEVKYSKDNSVDKNDDNASFNVVYLEPFEPLNVYYFSGNNNSGADVRGKTNVLFANHCWQALRTTDTGGVKLLYNGEPDNGSCGFGRPNHYGYAVSNYGSYKTLTPEYSYGTDFSYDSENKVFYISGDISSGNWSDSTYNNLLNKYTCMSNDSSSSCSTLYYVASYKSSTEAYVFPLVSDKKYSSIGVVPFNPNNKSPAYVGYMYNKVYDSQTTSGSIMGTFETTYYDSKYDLSYYTDIENNELYPYTYDEDSKTWTSTMHEHSTSASFKFKVPNNGDYVLIYNVSSESGCDKIWVYKNSTQLLTDSGVKNGRIALDALTTDDVIEVKYSKDGSVNSNSDNISFAIGYEEREPDQVDTRALFSDDIEYVDNHYRLINPYKIDTTSVNSKYMCLDGSAECESVIFAYFASSSKIYYYLLENGALLGDLFYEMLGEDSVNTKDSFVKISTEAWYKKNMLEYDSLIEDTVFCNNRRLYGDTYEFYNPVTKSIRNIESTMDCVDVDRYSTNNPKAKLQYKVGLITRGEVTMIKNAALLLSGAGSIEDLTKSNYNNRESYYTMSPDRLYSSSSWSIPASPAFVGGQLSSVLGGTYLSAGSAEATGIKPVISLIPGIEYESGDGSYEHPYVIKETLDD